ncbi:MAG: FliM/FliN family flagellar motor switch protein [Actinobacteria bacterium]|nr:FliM/FliN family flagellar motor switch protein [Actinomycetota bacterium]NIU18953.1 FliM/FliN family flagellar motor switch protein [Actinomycetota bacterium]NIU65972.1 FliM/FliN family flagellar motor switch protein [Actinomycetota bacterium]
MTAPHSAPALAAAPPEPFAALHDLPCPVTVRLGTASLTVRHCLALAPGSVVVLDQAAGTDLTLQVNGVTLARGEVVIVEDITSLRITSIEVTAAAGGPA